MRNHWLEIHRQRQAHQNLLVAVKYSLSLGGEQLWSNGLPFQDEVKFQFDAESYCWNWGLIVQDKVQWVGPFHGAPFVIRPGDVLNLKLKGVVVTLPDEHGNSHQIKL